MVILNKNGVALFFLCLAISVIALVPFGRGNVSGLEVAFPLLLFSVLLLSFNKSVKDEKTAVMLFFFLLWAAWCLLGITYSYFNYRGTVDHGAAYLRYIRLIEMYLPGVLIITLTNGFRGKQLKKTSWFFIFLFIFITAEAVVGFVFQIDSLIATQMYKYPGMGYVYRAGGVAKDSSAYSSLILIVGITALIEVKRVSKSRLLYYMLIFCFLINIYLSMSRSLMVSSVIYIILRSYYGGRIKPGTLLFSVFLMAVVFIYGLNNEYVSSFFNRIAASDNSGDVSSGRFATWALLLGLIGDNPLLGVGYRLSTAKYDLIPDNMFLSLSVETGIIGLLLYFSFFIMLCVFVYKKNKEKFPLLIAYLASGCFIDISTFWVSIPVLFLSMVMYLNPNGE